MMIVLPNKHCNWQHKSTEQEGYKRTPGEEIVRKKWGQQDTSTAGGR